MKLHYIFVYDIKSIQVLASIYSKFKRKKIKIRRRAKKFQEKFKVIVYRLDMFTKILIYFSLYV